MTTMILHRHHPSSLRSLRRQHWIKWLQITTVFLWSLFPPFYSPAPAAYSPDSQSPPQPVWDGNGDEPESGPDLSDDDSDGLPNWFEQWLGSDVGNPDTDYDGLSDADEQYLTGTDPINWDSNSDGYSDHDAFYNCWAVNHNAVGFGQSVYDWDGDCIYNPQDPWPFDANNGSYDPSTSDSDGDGYADANDSHPYDYSVWGDWGTDGDSSGDPDPGEGNPEPTDDDSDDDGHPDGQDSDPNDSSLWDDANRNGINDSAEIDPYTHDSDNDGFVDALDSNPWDPVLWSDWNSNNQNDEDESGGGDPPEDPVDSDGDTVLDPNDSHPNNSSLWNDFNGNNINDDDNDPLFIDTDLDGVPDWRDSHPNWDQLWNDFNSNNLNDDHPTDDLDGDSHSNETDSHPSNSDLWEDWDNDGINDSDSGGGGGSDDSDSDNYPNHLDSHPQESTLWSDWDFDSLNLDDELAHQTDPHRPDTDQDGLTDGEEVSYATNPTRWDTDNDGLSDFEELRGTFGSNPRDAYSLSKNRGWGSLYDDWQMASLVDTDLDGIPNRIEELYGLNPNYPQDAASDLDGDGITNRIAYQQGRALIAIVTPLDRDGDGLTDAQEDFWGRRNPGLLSKFNPQDAVKDPDIDDLMNWQEVQFGSNPGIAVSTPHGKIGNVNDGTVYFWQSLIQSNSSYHFLALTRLPQGYHDSINDWMDTDYNPDANGSPTITPPGLQAFLSTVSPIDRLPGRKASGDYDGDGMPDQWEWRYRQKLSTLDSADAGTPNQTPTLKQDPDSDALSNLAEFQLNTHPLLPDTDGDGFADGLEVQHGSSPTQVTSLPPLSLTVISGNSQTALVDTIATQPLIVATRRITTPVPSTPVTFTVSPPTAGQISTSPTGPWTSTVSTTSSSTGNAQVYWKAPASPGNSVVTAVSPSHPTISPVNFSLAATNPSPNPTPGPGPGTGPGGSTTPPPGTMVWQYAEKSVTVQSDVSEESAKMDSNGNWQPPPWVTRLGISSYRLEDTEDPSLGGRMVFDPPISFYEVRAGSPLATVKHGNGASAETNFADYLLTAQSHYLNQNMVFGPDSPTGDVFADDKQDISRFVNERQMRWVVQGGVLSESQSRSFLVKCATKSYAQGAPPEEIKYFPVSFRANAGLASGTLASVEISNPGPAATHGIRVAGQTLVLQPPMVANQRTVLSLLPVEFKKMWETKNKANQIVNKTRKDDPKTATQTPDAGDNLFGTPRYLLYVATDPLDGKYHISVDVQAGQRDQWLCAAYRSGTKVAGTDKAFPAANDQPADLEVPAVGSDSTGDDFVVKVAFDANKNGTIDSGETPMDLEVAKSESGSPAPPMVRGFSSGAVNSADTKIQSMAWGTTTANYWGGVLVVPGAVSLLRVFYQGNATGLSTGYSPTSTAPSISIECFGTIGDDFKEWLSHNAGAEFSDSGHADLKQYFWDDQTNISKIIAAAAPLANLKSYSPLVTKADRDTQSVVDAFRQSSVSAGTAQILPNDPNGNNLMTVLDTLGVPHWSPGWVSKQTVLVGNPDGSFFGIIPNDAFGMVGRSRFKDGRYWFVVKKENRVKNVMVGPGETYPEPYTAVVVYLRVQGTSEDLYDFNHACQGLSEPAAITQLSYGNGSYTGRNHGHIYRAKVDVLHDYEMKEIRLN